MRHRPPPAFVRLVALLAPALWLPAPAAAIAICGDGVCQSTAVPPETSTSCAADCGGPDPSACVRDTCSTCTQPAAGVDNDWDGIPDRLEYDLAHKFFPAILLQGFEDDLNESYVYRREAMPYTVQPLQPPTSICDDSLECLEIRYGTAYHYDSGDTYFGITSHGGDAEFFVALVQRTTSWTYARDDAAYWQMIRDFTAAHWKTPGESSRYGAYGSCPPNCHAWDDDEESCHAHARHCGWFPGACTGGADAQGYPCSWYADEPSCYFSGGSCNWVDSRCSPDVSIGCYALSPLSGHRVYYAAEGKHGLYHLDSECESGGFASGDACPFNRYNMRDYKGQYLQNVGSWQYHGSFDTVMQHPTNCKLHDVWSGEKFGESSDWKKQFLETFNWMLP